MAVALTVVAGLLVAGPAGASTASCDRVVSAAGSDANPGTVESPWRSAPHMVEQLAAGQTGCFQTGTYPFDEIDIVRSDITLTSFPGERATLRGTLKVERGADRVTVSDLDLDGRGSTSVGPFVFANDTTFDNVDVTNYHSEVCFVVGTSNPADGYAAGTVIENSRIHDCGRMPPENGDHGIYVEHASDTVIRDNWIYDNADRGIQLYPESHRAQVYGNVIDGNGEGIIISDASSGNTVHDNVISNSTIRWNVEASNLYGAGNVVHDNCVWASNDSGNGYYKQNGGILPLGLGGEAFTAVNNRVANPQFVDRARGDLDLQADSPCLAPSAVISIRPTAKQVQAGSQLRLRGQVQPAGRTHVIIQIQRHRGWRKFARVKVRPSGRFTVRRRLSHRLAAQRVRLRAKVPHLGRSRPVAIRVRD